MTSRLLLPSLRCSLLAACLTASALAQSTTQSSLDRAIISSTAQLSPAQKTAIATFASKYVTALETATAAKDIEDARTALVNPSRDPSSTATFRKAYAIVLAEDLAPVIKGTDLRRAINAMQVLRFTSTSEGLDVLLDRVSVATEPDAGKRIAASGLVGDAFESLDANNAYYEIAARRLRDAAAVETEWMALQQKLNAIGAAAKIKNLPADNARTVRRSQAEALAAIAKASKASTAADSRVLALQRVLVVLRNDLLVMPAADRSLLAKTLAPALADVLAAANNQWSAARASADMTAAYSSVVNSCEVILRLIDRSERPAAYAGSKPDADSRVLAASWDAQDSAKFGTEVKRWESVVGAAPYKN